MKRKYFILMWIGCLMASSMHAQLIQPAPKGNFIWISPESVTIDNAVIYRKGASDKDFRKIGETTIPASVSEIEKRIQVWQKDFPHLPDLSQKEKEELLDMAGKRSVPKANRLKYNPVAMGILGQAWYDKETLSGVRLTYKVVTGNTEKIIEPLLWPAKIDLPAAGSPDVNEAPDRITIRWKLTGKQNADGYRIYRRTAMKGEFEPRPVPGGFNLAKDTWYLVVTDTLVEPLAMYEYKAAALDKLGNSGAESDPVRARTRGNNVLPFFAETSGLADAEGVITLKWKLMMPQLARSINIYRSKFFDKDFTIIGRASITDTLYVDNTVEPNENQYYKLEVLMDEGSRTSAVISVLGKTNYRPDPPERVAVKADKDLVTITWIPDPSSGYGYYVYMQNAIGDPAIQVSHLIAPDSGKFTFKPPVIGSNYSYYFSVKTVGFDYKLSEPSRPIEVMLRGLSSVLPPSSLTARYENGSVIITWDEQFSQNENVMGYVVSRKIGNSKVYEKLPSDTLNPKLGFVEDTVINPGKEYVYKVEVRDYFGATAYSEVSIIPESMGLTPPSQLIISPTGKGVFLRWEVTTQPVKNCRVYSYETGVKPKMIAELPGKETSYLDNTVAKGKLLNYFVKYVSPDGVESVPGTVKSIRLK